MAYRFLAGTNSALIFRGARVFQPDFFLLDQPLCSLWYKMYACHRTDHQSRKRTEAVTITARGTDKNDYYQDRGKWHSDSYLGGNLGEYKELIGRGGDDKVHAAGRRCMGGAEGRGGGPDIDRPLCRPSPRPSVISH